jgi:thiamine pyrophosphokinase
LRRTILPGGGFFVLTARLIIFTNGLVPDLESVRRLIQPGDVICAADGGSRHALSLGLLPAVLIGDLDSLTPDERQVLNGGNVDIHQYPRNKDKTDLELALDYALQTGYREILVIGALGGRLDQTLANLALLNDPRLSTCDIRFDDGVEEVFFTRSRCEIHGGSADIVSLIPWGGEVTGIRTEGLQWPLHCETLLQHQTRGISNELLDESATITIQTGLLLIVHRRSQEYPSPDFI